MTTNGNRDCIDRHGWQDLSRGKAMFAVLEIMQSVGVKVKRLFVLELLLECSVTDNLFIFENYNSIK